MHVPLSSSKLGFLKFFIFCLHVDGTRLQIVSPIIELFHYEFITTLTKNLAAARVSYEGKFTFRWAFKIQKYHTFFRGRCSEINRLNPSKVYTKLRNHHPQAPLKHAKNGQVFFATIPKMMVVW